MGATPRDESISRASLMNPKIHGLHLINRIITIINRDLYAAYDCLYQKMISRMIDGLTGVRGQERKKGRWAPTSVGQHLITVIFSSPSFSLAAREIAHRAGPASSSFLRKANFTLINISSSWRVHGWMTKRAL